jgi:hypothetical protein
MKYFLFQFGNRKIFFKGEAFKWNNYLQARKANGVQTRETFRYFEEFVVFVHTDTTCQKFFIDRPNIYRRHYAVYFSVETWNLNKLLQGQ